VPPGVGIDPLSLDALYRAHAPAALRLSVLLTGDRALGEDIVQDAFIRVAARSARLRDSDAFGAYLRRAVINQSRSHFRHQRVVRKHQAVTHTSETTVDPDRTLRQDVWEALHRLPERQRVALVLRFYEDQSVDAIATTLGCRPGTVKSLISRGLAHLRGEVRDV
jgi:RNA polymerase sigma-70 factor (sigma-E family)